MLLIQFYAIIVYKTIKDEGGLAIKNYLTRGIAGWVGGLDAGCWVLDAGYWMLETGYWILDAGYWILDTGGWMLGTDTRYWILDTGCWLCTLQALVPASDYQQSIINYTLSISHYFNTRSNSLKILLYSSVQLLGSTKP